MANIRLTRDRALQELMDNPQRVLEGIQVAPGKYETSAFLIGSPFVPAQETRPFGRFDLGGDILFGPNLGTTLLPVPIEDLPTTPVPVPLPDDGTILIPPGVSDNDLLRALVMEAIRNGTSLETIRQLNESIEDKFTTKAVVALARGASIEQEILLDTEGRTHVEVFGRYSTSTGGFHLDVSHNNVDFVTDWQVFSAVGEIPRGEGFLNAFRFVKLRSDINAGANVDLWLTSSR